MHRFLPAYWLIYFLGYLISIGILLWLYWGRLMDGDGQAPIYLLAAVFGTAAGAASAFAIVVEGGGRIVLLIPATVKKLINKGRREERRDVGERYREAHKRFGVETERGVMLPDTPEVRRLLYGDVEESGGTRG